MVRQAVWCAALFYSIVQFLHVAARGKVTLKHCTALLNTPNCGTNLKRQQAPRHQATKESQANKITTMVDSTLSSELF
jgi:hypothetical protein